MLGWAAFGAGILIKGPLVALICGASIASVSLYDRDWRWLSRLHVLPGFALVLLIVAPWAIAIGIASEGQFYRQSLGQDFALKLMGDQETHGGPPGYYALLMHLTFWPGSLALLPGSCSASPPPRASIRFCAVAATTCLMFEIAPHQAADTSCRVPCSRALSPFG